MGEQREALVRRTRRRLSATGTLANGLGATVVVGFLLFVAPIALKSSAVDEMRRRSLPFFFIFMAVTLPGGSWLIDRRPFARIRDWLREERPASEEERAHVLRYPRNWAVWSFWVWATGGAAIAALNVGISARSAVAILIGTLLGGATACSLQYLLVERIMRPVTALALVEGVPRRSGAPSVAHRMTMAWALATGVPLLGIAAFAAFYLSGAKLHADRLVGAELFLSGLALSVGLAAMLFATQSVAEPLTSMRRALASVEGGDLDTRVAIDDASEVGLLQAGFNRMTSGLAERERLRDAFGAFVDPSLTERVLAEGTDLAGEEVDVSLLFMDVRGFTSFSERAAAPEVVATLNGLYTTVVPVVLKHGGHASKFIGDGLLAVFGAPDRLSDHAVRAVAAGQEIVQLVNGRDDGGLRVGVGINSGRVVAGTIGGGGRVDFTVIGDPVNTAARVESATRESGDDLLITDSTRELLDGDQRAWIERPAIALKGKSQQVRLYARATRSQV
jgi:adenylate cyclase